MSKRFDYLFNPVFSQPSISPIADMPSYNHQSHLPPTPPECWPYYTGVQHGPQFLNAQEYRGVEKSVDSYRGFSNSGPFQFETTPYQSRSESLFPPRQQANYHGIPPPGITHPNNNHWYGAVALPPPSQKRVELPPIDGNGFERQVYQVCIFFLHAAYIGVFLLTTHSIMFTAGNRGKKQENKSRPLAQWKRSQWVAFLHT